MPPARYGRCAMIVAGEASGDLHGARLVRAMRQRDEHLFFCGIGGKSMAAEGVRILFDAHRLSVVGVTEVLTRLPDIVRGISIARSALKTLRPDLLILIDFPDFNLHLAAHARKLGIPVLYYIDPLGIGLAPWTGQNLEKTRGPHGRHSALKPNSTIANRGFRPPQQAHPPTPGFRARPRRLYVRGSARSGFCLDAGMRNPSGTFLMLDAAEGCIDGFPESGLWFPVPETAESGVSICAN